MLNDAVDRNRLNKLQIFIVNLIKVNLNTIRY
jgi:hypothetical protein